MALRSSFPTRISGLIKQLQGLDTACLCDAHKAIYSKLCLPSENLNHTSMRTIKGLLPRNAGPTMAGVARTVQFSRPNDLLAVLVGLEHAVEDEILVINSMDSTQAVAGELLCAEAARRNIRGILVDGPMRDLSRIATVSSLRCYSRSTAPYASSAQDFGQIQVPIVCGGAYVSPGDIVVGDDDGIIVGTADLFEQLVEKAKSIASVESNLMEQIQGGKSFFSLTNYTDHVGALKEGKPSDLSIS